MDAEDDEQNFGDEPEFDMEFFNSYGPNTLDLPLSPPNTPPLGPHNLPLTPPVRELSPFSTNTSMTSVTSTDSIGYYREEAGRMYAAMPDVPIVLPVDHAEMRRVSEQHELLKLLAGGNCTPQVQALLEADDGQTRHVLDIISNSPWVDEMAEEFPHVKFHGCNFVPTRHLHHENVQFEVYNLNEGIRGKDESFDVIHAQGTFKTTRNYKAWLAEFKRLLKPGGLLVIRDLEMAVWMRDGSDPRDATPALSGFTDCVNKSLLAQSIPIHQMPLVGTWLRELGGFTDVADTVTCFPVGVWDPAPLQQEIGAMARDNIMSALYSVHPLYRRMGKTLVEVERLVQDARAELCDTRLNLFERFFHVVARRVDGNGT